MNKKEYEIINVLNHNTLLCNDNNKKETYVFFGKGIGFKKKRGDIFIENNDIENFLLALEKDEAIKYKELLEQVSSNKLIDVVQEIVYKANESFNYGINAKLNLTLLDHLNFAWQRQKNNIIINYPFLDELRFIYPKEYDFSKKALYYLNEKMKPDICFDEAELGFLVLHIHAALKNEKVSNVLLNREIVHMCIGFIERKFNERIDRKTIYYSRFVKHLEYAIHRYRKGIQLQNVLLNSVKDICKNEYYISKELNIILKTKYHIDLDENELGYLTLHIYNLKNRNK